MLRTCYLLACLGLSLTGATSYAQTLLSEDFANGLPPTWENLVREGNGQASAAWLYTTVGPTGPIGGEPLRSPTADNGWMIFDSDLNCHNGFAQDAWLISPPIAATDAPTVFLRFSTYYQSFNDRPQIRMGADLDELDNWATLEVFPGIRANQFGGPDPDGNINPVTLYFDLSPWLAGRDDQRIAFQFLSNNNTRNGGGTDIACAYAWQIDDVAVTIDDPRPDYEMGINRFASIAPNAQTPRCQIEPIHFLADVANNGRATPDSTVLHLTIQNPLGDTLFRDQVGYGPIAPDSVAENVFFPQAFLPSPEESTYIGTYQLDYPGDNADALLENNTFSFIFRVSEDTYSKELGATRSIAPAAAASYSYGNVFYVPRGGGNTIEEISFAVANAEALSGRRATVFVATWDGRHRNQRYLQPDEYETVGLADYTFRGDEGIGRISVPVRTIADDEPILLRDSTHYLVGVEYNSPDAITMELLASEDYDYFATIFQTDSLNMPRYNAILNVAGVEALGEFDLVGFGYDVAPTIRMKISPCAPVSSSDLTTSAGALARVYPNPASDQLTVAFPFVVAEAVVLEVYDLTGKLLQQYSYAGGMNQEYVLDLQPLAAGSYFLKIRTPKSLQTIRIVKH
jgi:hypothetical protein